MKPLSAPRDAPTLTPRTFCLYNFGESPADLRVINERLQPKVRQRLNFDEDEPNDVAVRAPKRSKMRQMAQRVFRSQGGAQGDTHDAPDTDMDVYDEGSDDGDHGEDEDEEGEDEDEEDGEEGG